MSLILKVINSLIYWLPLSIYPAVSFLYFCIYVFYTETGYTVRDKKILLRLKKIKRFFNVGACLFVFLVTFKGVYLILSPKPDLSFTPFPWIAFFTAFFCVGIFVNFEKDYGSDLFVYIGNAKGDKYLNPSDFDNDDEIRFYSQEIAARAIEKSAILLLFQIHSLRNKEISYVNLAESVCIHNKIFHIACDSINAIEQEKRDPINIQTE
jgi:hypothetical protein